MGIHGLRCDVCELDPALGKDAGCPRERSGRGRCDRCSRAAFLCGARFRDDAEDEELTGTVEWLRSQGREFPWPILPREED